MANSKGAEKRIRQNVKRRERNRSHRSNMRRAVKSLRAAIDAGDTTEAQSLLKPTIKVIDSTAQKKVIHANAAARLTSRLTRAVNALSA